MTSRFTSECELCTELLTDYISTANETVDAQERLQTRPSASASELASALIGHALKQREKTRDRFLQHKDRTHQGRS